jgi:WD40 repeat protein
LDLSRDFYDVAFSPDASLVVVGSAEGRLMMGSLDDLTRLSEFIQLGAQQPEIRKAEEFFQANNMRIRPEIRRVAYASGAAHVSVTGDGRVIVAQSEGGVSLWDPAISSAFEFDRPWLDGHEQSVPHAVSADGRHVLDATRQGTIRLSDVTSGTALVSTRFPSPKVLAVSADADLVAAVDTAGGPASWRTLAVWDASGRTRLRAQIDRRVAPLIEPRTFPTQLLIAGPPDQHLVGVALGDGTAAAWAIDAKESHLLGVRREAARIAVNPRGSELAVADRDGVVSIWEPQSGRVKRLPGAAGRVMALSYSDDAHALAAVIMGRDGVAFVRWDLIGGGEPVSWTFTHSPLVEGGVAISGDLRLLAVAAESAVDVWDTEAQAIITSRVVAGIESMTFDREGGLVAGRLDGVTYIDLNPARLAGYVCGITARTLTAEESQRYLGAASPSAFADAASPSHSRPLLVGSRPLTSVRGCHGS